MQCQGFWIQLPQDWKDKLETLYLLPKIAVPMRRMVEP